MALTTSRSPASPAWLARPRCRARAWICCASWAMPWSAASRCTACMPTSRLIWNSPARPARSGSGYGRGHRRRGAARFRGVLNMTGSPAAQTCLLYFDDERPAARAPGRRQRPGPAARAAPLLSGWRAQTDFAGGRAGQLPVRAVLLRSLYQPNDKLVELLLAARAARALGVRHLTLVAPYFGLHAPGHRLPSRRSRQPAHRWSVPGQPV